MFDPAILQAIMQATGAQGDKGIPAPSTPDMPLGSGFGLLNNIPGMGGPGKVPGMGQVPMGEGMAGITGMEGTDKVPGKGLADTAEAYAGHPNAGTPGGQMAAILGMQALKELSAPPQRQLPTIAAGAPPRPQTQQLQMPAPAAPGGIPPGLAQLMMRV